MRGSTSRSHRGTPVGGEGAVRVATTPAVKAGRPRAATRAALASVLAALPERQAGAILAGMETAEAVAILRAADARP